ncbi:MAG: pitrilysin family protein [Myxococcota bacterium]
MSSSAVHSESLPNGLTVLLQESRTAPVAEFQIWARAGSADERDDERGLAHFHEHMLFKGTERRGVGAVAGEVEGAGGRINAYTSYDVTVYHATLPSEALSTGIDVLSDAVLHSVFDPEEIDREIEVVLEEIRRSDDSPGSVLGNAVFEAAYTAHPYRFPILGSHESVASLDRARLRRFYDRWYTPDNLVVVCVGDFDRDAVLAQVRGAFGDVAPSGVERRRTSEPLQQRLRSTVLARPFERASAELCYPGVGLSHPDAPYLDLLSFLLGNCESSRLVRSVKERAQLVDRIDSWCYTPLDPGVLAIDIDTDSERMADAIAASVAEVERLRSEPVSADELEKGKSNFLASEHFERESVSGLAAKLGGFHVTGGGLDTEARYLEAVRTASAEDLRRVARDHWRPEALTVGVLLPEADAAVLDASGVEAAVARGVATNERVTASPRATHREDELVSFALPSGAELHVVPRRNVPVVAARAAFRGGLLTEDAATSGISAFLASMWLRGTESHSSAGFARAVESRAAEIDAFSGRSSFGLTLEAPSAGLDPILDLFCEVMLAPAFDVAEFERERSETLAAIERREDRLAQRAFLLLAEHLYPTHPYRMPTLGQAEVIQGLRTEHIQAHHDRWVRAENLVLAVSGDVDPDAVAQGLASRLADLPSGDFEAPTPPLDTPQTEIRRAELVKERAQAHLVIGFPGLDVADDDRFALEVISQLLAGQSGRLFLELRDKQGLAYSVTATSIEGLAPGYFAVYIATAPEKLEDARTGLLEELEKLVQGAPPQDELDAAIRHLVGNYQIDRQRNAVHAAHTSLNALYGLGADAGRHYAERVRAVTRDDVLRVAQRLVKLDAYTEAVVRGS